MWLAWEDTAEALLYGYVPNLGEFVRFDALAHDYYRDTELEYRPVGSDEAAQIIKAGQVGKLDARTWQKDTLDHLAAVDDRKTPVDLLGGSAASS